jgi:hypothetical protein
MGEFFRGWRRKVGVLTLMMACVAMGGWVRSSFIKDHLTSVDGLGSSIQATSFDCHFGVVARKGFAPTGRAETRLRQSAVESIHGWAKEREGWRWYRLGFGMVNNKWDGGYLKGWFAHFGSIVIPLTLLSAFLLLNKPRESNRKKIPEPVATEGT